MLLIHCPYCGEERPELEFRHAGEAHIARSKAITETSDEDFEAFLYLRANTKGLVYERWRHLHGCGRFFNAVRDSVTDRFFITYKAGQPKPDPSRFAKAVAAVEPIAIEAAVVVSEPRLQPAAPAKAPRKVAAAPEVGGEPAGLMAPDIMRNRAKAKGAPEAALAAEAKPKRKSPAKAKPVDATKASPRKARKPVEPGIAESEAASEAPSKRIRRVPVKKGDA
ncbi:hypothetical protein EJC49_13810 [Aquibium carbonis]|uniref:Sarcosine oxidase subunit delta n=1 Tax=Aquibium carbonis TaxID=2495581 RepID=A0A429YWG1_9HYPH|nr:hypothetical protein EJC49_13810 [Aquibium carbonis]